MQRGLTPGRACLGGILVLAGSVWAMAATWPVRELGPPEPPDSVCACRRVGSPLPEDAYWPAGLAMLIGWFVSERR